ncbi:MAG: TolC family outer membrane protein [Cypionkella sp.]|uniref:TolC family outer membrane protein n=1 Tax=Cypionkella sp. TaxID=2811411 RepID=UPI002ABB5457|nr:TolC family outer membrane protein [Cypionkella sp.]MDZ4311905.1 TolC family outer membrane protein [Cypionkella sp.]MDZ4391465.1 TolC family outer membrane protein [Cypionkella sp.]
MQKFWAAVAVTAAMVAAPAARSETLADALISAYRSSNLLDQNQAVLRAADEDAAIALAQLRPVITFATQASWTKTDNDSPIGNILTGVTPAYSESTDASASLTASFLIYAGGRSKMAIDVAKESVLSTREALVRVEQQVLLDAVSAYVNVRLQIEIVALRQSNVRLISQELQAAKDRFEVGEVTLTDVSLAEARRAAAQAGLAAAQGALEAARERYKAAIGHYPSNLASLPKLPVAARSEDAARAIAVRNHPVIKQAGHEVKISDIRVDIAKTAFLPTVSSSLTVTEDWLSGQGNTVAGIRFSDTIYQGGERSALFRKALAGKEASAAAQLQAVVDVSEAVGNAWSNVMVQQASIEAGGLQVTAAQKAFEGVREEATLGARTTLDVLNAEQELLDARATKLEAEASRYVGVYQLLSTMGQLTADQLNLGITTFDPDAYYNAVKKAPLTSTRGKKLDKILEKIGN